MIYANAFDRGKAAKAESERVMKPLVAGQA